VENVLLDRDVGGDHDAVDGGDHRRSFGEARSGEAAEERGRFGRCTMCIGKGLQSLS
jgi:hypothetical protein